MSRGSSSSCVRVGEALRVVGWHVLVRAGVLARVRVEQTRLVVHHLAVWVSVYD